MADHSLPTTSSTYTNFVTEMSARVNSLAGWLNTGNTSGTNTNVPQFTVRWNATNFNWDIQNSATVASPSWITFITRLDIANFNGIIGATTPANGTFTNLTANTAATLPASTTIGGVAPVTVSAAQTLTNKTLTLPIISSISNTGTITLPTSTDTLVGRATTDTLTNKTLTTPKFTSATSLQDANGAILLQLPTAVTSAVNYLFITNNIAGSAPYITVNGTDTNINLNLLGKGTGIVTLNGIAAVDISSTQTLTNKTLTSPVISSISNGGTVTIPAGTDTLVTLTATQSLSNKTLTGSAFNGTVGATTASTGAFTTLTASTSLSVTGTATATTFSGAGTNLTGTASSLTVGNSTNAVNIGIADDTTNVSTVYLGWVTSTTGNLPVKTSSTKLTFVPSTGTLTATAFSGSGASLTGTAASLVAGKASTISQGGGVGTAMTLTYTSTGGTPSFVFGTTDGVTWNAYNPANFTVSTASTANALNTANNYSVATAINFYNAGVGSGSIVSSNATNGMVYTPSINGSTNSHAWNNAAGTAVMVLDSSGNVTATANVTAYSDERLKKDWRPLPEFFLYNLSNIKYGTYTRKDSGQRQVGVSAQDLKKVLPEAVLNGELLSVAYGNAALVACIELAKEVLELKKQIKALQ